MSMSGYTYIIHCEGFFKIGKVMAQARLPSRLNDMQVGNPFLVTIVAIVPGYGHELHWHKEAAEYRVRGEWFALPSSMLDDVQEMLQMPAFSENGGAWFGVPGITGAELAPLVPQFEDDPSQWTETKQRISKLAKWAHS